MNVEKSYNRKRPVGPQESKSTDSSGEPDSELIAATKRGEGRAFDTLVRRYEKRIFSVAFRIVRNREDAQDVVQQCFMKAFVHLEAFEGQSAFSTWLTRIAINEALMILRRVRANKAISFYECEDKDSGKLPLEIPDSNAGIEELYQHLEKMSLLSSATNQLTPGMRRTIELTLAERTVAETAEIMRVSIPAVKARLFHARRKLRPLLTRLLEPARRVARTNGARAA